MREIKFRAWDKKNKSMLQGENIFHKDNGFYINHDDKMNSAFIGLFNGFFGPTDLEFMQFTGLKDKNGREIYEGDLLRFYIQVSSEARPYQKSELIRVSMLYGCWGFEHVFPELCHEDDRAFRPFWKDEDKEMWSQNYFEVIGNIYENPELVKP